MATKPKAAVTTAPAPAPAPIAVEVVAAPVEAPPVETAPAEAAAPSAAPIETPLPAKPGMEKVMKTAEEFVAFGQGNVEAIVKSSQIWVAGVQDLSKQVAITAQAQFDETMSVFKAMSGMKSLKDVFDLQSSFARAALEKSVTESGKLTDASLKLTEQALAPITARVTTAVETFSKAA